MQLVISNRNNELKVNKQEKEAREKSMNELFTDFWSLLLPEEQQAEQEGETIIITDNDEVSLIEMTTLVPEEGMSVSELLNQFKDKDAFKTAVAELTAYYQEFEEDEVYWREWYVDAETFVLAISHGSDISNKNMDDSSVDEILATLALKKKEEEQCAYCIQ